MIKKEEIARRGLTSLQTIVSPDNKQILLEKDTIIAIANKISSVLGKKLSEGDIHFLVSEIISKIPPEQCYGKTKYNFITLCAKIYLTNPRSEHPSGIYKNVVEEYLYDEVMKLSPSEHPYSYTSSPARLGDTAMTEKKRLHELGVSDIVDRLDKLLRGEGGFIDKISSSRAHLQTFANITLPHRVIQFDSRYRDQTKSTDKLLSWNVHSAPISGVVGSIRLQDTLQYMISVKISTFYFPPFANDKDTFYKQIRMEILEFKQSSVTVPIYPDITSPTKSYMNNYHFEFIVTDPDTTTRNMLTPSRDTFVFNKPIANIDSITVRFYNPFEIITLPTDTLVFIVTPANPTLLTSAVAHVVNTGDLIYILDADSGNSIVDGELNDPKGLIATKINNTQITVDVDSSVVLNPFNVTVFFAKHRIFFELEFINMQL